MEYTAPGPRCNRTQLGCGPSCPTTAPTAPWPAAPDRAAATGPHVAWRVEDWLSGQTNHRKGGHRYTLDDFGLDDTHVQRVLDARGDLPSTPLSPGVQAA